MTIEQALEELKKYAQEFAKIGDAKQAISNNKEEFLHRWSKVNQYYKYVVNNTKGMSDEWFAAIDIISDIAVDNPSLEEWIQQMLESKNEKIHTQSKTETSIDISKVIGTIESLTSEVMSMQSWDPNHIGDIKWQLQEYQELLTSNQSLLEPNAYQSLMNDITTALDKISKFENMLKSEKFADIVKM